MSTNDSNGQIQGGAENSPELEEIDQWACWSANAEEQSALVAPAIGKRLRGVKGGQRIRTGPVARAEGLVVSFLRGDQPSLTSFRLRHPHPDYRNAIDSMRHRAGLPMVDWEGDPFRSVGEAVPERLAVAIQEVQRDLARDRKRANQPSPVPPRRGLLSLVLTPFAWLGRALRRRSKQGKAEQKATTPIRRGGPAKKSNART
jgi:hypothetical protein